MTQFQKLLAFCHNGVGPGKASSFHPICWCVCACMCMCIPVLGSHQDIWVILQSYIGLPPGHLGNPPVMYWAPTRTYGWSSSHVLGSHQDIWVILQSCIGLPPGLLGDPPIMYYAPTRTSVLSSSDVFGSHQDIWVILHDI